MKMYKQIMALMIFALLFGFGAFIEDASAASKSKKVTKGADDFTVETEMGIDGYASYDAPAQILKERCL